jgi:protein-S-isoprenylcysteine O-methyltransferase Ste14
MFDGILEKLASLRRDDQGLVLLYIAGIFTALAVQASQSRCIAHLGTVTPNIRLPILLRRSSRAKACRLVLQAVCITLHSWTEIYLCHITSQAQPIAHSTKKENQMTISKDFGLGAREYAQERTFLGVRHSFISKVPLVFVFSFLATAGIVRMKHILMNWGSLDHEYLLFANGVATVLFSSLIVLTTCFRLKPLKKASGIQPKISALLGSFLSFSLMIFPMPELPVSVASVALAMMIVGTTLSFYVLLWLGRSFSIMAEARRLVTSGPYSVVRHPLYICEQIAVFGALILHFSPVAMILILLHCTIQFKRMENEERVLRHAFPEYGHYAASVPRLLPLRLLVPRRLRRAWLRRAAEKVMLPMVRQAHHEG